MFKAGMEEQCKDMSSFIANFNWVQEQQLNTMNTLVGALTNFFLRTITTETVLCVKYK